MATCFPCSLSTALAAAATESSLDTSTCTSSTVPDKCWDCSSLTALSPFSIERDPRRTWLEASASSWRASSKPMPLLATIRKSVLALAVKEHRERTSGDQHEFLAGRHNCLYSTVTSKIFIPCKGMDRFTAESYCICLCLIYPPKVGYLMPLDVTTSDVGLLNPSLYPWRTHAPSRGHPESKSKEGILTIRNGLYCLTSGRYSL